MGKTMMYRTCTVQVNLDFESESDMVNKMRVAIALQPVSTALFSNSPFFEGKLLIAKVGEAAFGEILMHRELEQFLLFSIQLWI